MKKREYFLEALRQDLHRYKRWVIEAFSVTQGNLPWGERYGDGYINYALKRDERGRAFIYQGEKDLVVYIDDVQPNEPAFAFHESLTLVPGDLPNVNRIIDTTYGVVLVNQLLLVYPFGDKIDFMEGVISIPRIEKIIETRLRDNPAEGEVEDPRYLYVSEYIKFNEAAFALAGYSQLCVPSATPKTMTTDPAIKKRREELLNQYRGRLHDPVIQAKISEELIAMDRAWLKGDAGEGFYIKDKSYKVVRKKTFLLQGVEQGFGSDAVVIETSLSDGWDIDNLPAMGNSLREGSYNRGYNTMLGGEATKFNYRIFQNTVVSEEDCGSTVGLPTRLTAQNIQYYYSNSVITPTGPVEITPENAQKYMDKVVYVRSPAYCRTGGANYCATCMGKKIAETPQAISTYAADIGSRFLSSFMAAMHGKALETARYSIEDSIS